MLDGIIAGIIQQILTWAGQYPVVAVILIVIGVLRAVMKPLMSLLHAFVAATPGTADDKVLDNVEQSKIYTTFLYILDWFTSIKPPPAQAKK